MEEHHSSLQAGIPRASVDLTEAVAAGVHLHAGRSFVGIDSGNIPYPILTFAALMPWVHLINHIRVSVYGIGRKEEMHAIYMLKDSTGDCGADEATLYSNAPKLILLM